MFRKMLLVFTGIGAAGFFTVFLLTIPLLRRLPKQSRVSVDGVWIGDEELDVCPGSVNNKPDVTQFEILSKVLPWQPWIRPLTHVG
jgi:hypothetical protein